MITQTRFFGMPLVTQGQRRRVVVVYYAVVVLTIVPWLAFNVSFTNHAYIWVVQITTIGGFLGGIKPGGPVKSYRGTSDASPSSLQSLNLSGLKPWSFSTPLDERETEERNAAHYMAYKIVNILLFAVFFAYVVPQVAIQHWLTHHSPELFWLLVVVVVSLPQSVILWTEAPLAGSELSAISR